jgi:hypothetical protein
MNKILRYLSIILTSIMLPSIVMAAPSAPSVKSMGSNESGDLYYASATANGSPITAFLAGSSTSNATSYPAANGASYISLPNGNYYVWAKDATGAISSGTPVNVAGSCSNISASNATGSGTVERCFIKSSSGSETATTSATLATCAGGYYFSMGPTSITYNDCGRKVFTGVGLSQRYCRKTYNYVCSKAATSYNSKLADLSISTGDLTPSFSADTATYSASTTESSVNISATLQNSNASFQDGFGPRTVSLKYGLNNIYVKTSTSNGGSSNYLIKITREDNSGSSNSRSTNNYLSSLSVDGVEISPSFSSDTVNYTATVDGNVGEVNVDAALQDNSASFVEQRQYNYGYGLLYGFLLALILYNAMLYLGLRDRGYLDYSLYLGSFALLNLCYTGHGYAWFWPQYPAFQQYVILVMMVFAGCLGLRFASGFLNLRQHAPRANLFVRGLMVAGLLAISLSVLLQSQQTAVLIAFLFVLIFSVAMVWLGIITVQHGRVAGRYFLVAALSAMVGMATSALSVWVGLPYTQAGFHAAGWGVVIEGLLLTLALAYRMRQHQRARVEAEQLARLDSLTSLLNRRAFLECAGPLWSTALRNRRPLSVMMMDLDFFKKINDTYGHAMGDQVLVAASRVLAEACRNGDIAARWVLMSVLLQVLLLCGWCRKASTLFRVILKRAPCEGSTSAPRWWSRDSISRQ